MVNFFEQQAAARRRTALCVVLYAVAVAAVTACVVPVLTMTGVFLGFAGMGKGERRQAIERTVDQITADPGGFVSNSTHLTLIAVATAATLALIFGSSIVRYVSLRRGGAAVAQGLGARRVPAATRDLKERRLLNVVEEMALASSVPVPDVFVMEGESGVNAFAAGHSPSDAAVCVTRGALDRLNREQLQGVIAHEFSHILNGDMKLNLRLMGLLFGIGCVGFLGRILLECRGGSDRKNPLPIAGIVLMIIGAVGLFFARMIRAMISRQREFLADASAVQFTRNPDGIGGALKVIGGAPREGRLDASRAAECSHMMFAAPGAAWLEGMMASHPPLKERIRRIDPHWDGRFVVSNVDQTIAEIDSNGRPTYELSYPTDAESLVQLLGPLEAARLTHRSPTSGPPAAVTPHRPAGISAVDVLRRVQEASSRLTALPARLVEPARDTFTARALLLAMLLDRNDQIRSAQLAMIADGLGEATQRNTTVIAQALAGADRSARLPLIDLAVRTLAALSPEQYRVFRITLEKVVHADARVDLFELCLEQSLVKHLDRRLIDGRPVPVQYYALHRLGEPIGLLLRAVAAAGQTPTDRARESVAEALQSLSLAAGEGDEPAGTDGLVAAMATLRAVTPKLRAKILTACAHVVGADNRIEPEEAELLKAIADTLDLPLSSVSSQS